MQTISDRISLVIQQSGLNKTRFAERLHLSQQFISSICAGVKQPSDRTITDICREFGVSRLWLVEGKGEMYEKRSMNQTLLEMANALMKESDDAFRKRFVMALLQNPPEWWDATEAFLRKLQEENEPRGA